MARVLSGHFRTYLAALEKMEVPVAGEQSAVTDMYLLRFENTAFDDCSTANPHAHKPTRA